MTTAERRADRKLVALDIDGTVIHEDETLSLAVIDAVQRVRDLGHEVTLATGRSWETTHPILEKLEIEPRYVVCANGAMTMRRAEPGEADDHGYVREYIETFDPEPVLARIRSFLPEGRFMVEDAFGYRLYTEGMQDWNLTNAHQVEFAELFGVEATRVVVVSPDHELDDFLALVDEMGLHQVSYAIGWTAWLDIAPEGVNKATALERVRSWLGIELDRVVAVGDGRNDIEMFTWARAAGRPVAMGQAPAEVKDAAGEATGDVEHDGLVTVLDSID
ncbi:HAD hydrolase family protein [Agromyces atrinae]|uniref:Haloacid dehalogenase n=1 Tax=Agromyces atrinae TaxID=592376 RepID=A0A4Q2MA74_9MICO|nr:HAD hydrolase family protein [Agromyces atrinae]NYD67469.1 hydroxymethylpyrimidine pyrophosphatase-like HAD family hydrolase [Agromyces atrinae]RXZ88307.1 haloacid dehalogenase [Agromyces atrinae]